jgi:nuclear-control-of-ATPase protein 2
VVSSEASSEETQAVPSEAGSEESEDHARKPVLRPLFGIADAVSGAGQDNLLGIIQSLSTTNSSRPLLAPDRIKQLLTRSGLPDRFFEHGEELTTQSPYHLLISWLVVAKAAVQLHGVVLNTLLDQIIPLNNDIWYWDEVLNSYTYSSLYIVQTSPWRFAAWSLDIYRDSIARMRSSSAQESAELFVNATHTGLSQQWDYFYSIVRESIRDRSFANVQRKVLSPVAFARTEARRKQVHLRKLRELTACGLGVLMSEGFQFVQEDDKVTFHDYEDLKGTVERSIALMDMVLKEVCHIDLSTSDFEEKVFAGVDSDPDVSVSNDSAMASRQPAVLGRRMLYIIEKSLPGHAIDVSGVVSDNGRPPRLVRYWLPGVVGLFSSTTVLQILVNRKADITDWIADFGATARDFWFNWVIEPMHKVVQTIRHDTSSEIAIMSRDSLKADRESLERMVVDFAIDKPHFAEATGSSLSEAQIDAIRTKVAEGDVTPVLRAYERDLRSPFTGAIRGDLVRSLLIQVQKTKVDLEVAMTGIDSLLKSQELVFGFVGMTPGMLVSIGVWRYLRGVFGGRTGQRKSKRAIQAIRVLRNIDRILSEAGPAQPNNHLSYKDHGLLLCEVHTLKSLAGTLMPRNIEKEFQEDLSDLAKMKGIQVQISALARLRWAYARWLQ